MQIPNPSQTFYHQLLNTHTYAIVHVVHSTPQWAHVTFPATTEPDWRPSVNTNFSNFLHHSVVTLRPGRGALKCDYPGWGPKSLENPLPRILQPRAASGSIRWLTDWMKASIYATIKRPHQPTNRTGQDEHHLDRAPKVQFTKRLDSKCVHDGILPPVTSSSNQRGRKKFKIISSPPSFPCNSSQQDTQKDDLRKGTTTERVLGGKGILLLANPKIMAAAFRKIVFVRCY